jgi:hypothetical protein
VVLYGCETRSLTLREEHRLRVFENRVLRRIFGPKRDEETGTEKATKVHKVCKAIEKQQHSVSAPNLHKSATSTQSEYSAQS